MVSRKNLTIKVPIIKPAIIKVGLQRNISLLLLPESHCDVIRAMAFWVKIKNPHP